MHSSHLFTNLQCLFYCPIKPNQLRLAFITFNNVALSNCPVFHYGIHLATCDSSLKLPFFKSKLLQRSSQQLFTVTFTTTRLFDRLHFSIVLCRECTVPPIKSCKDAEHCVQQPRNSNEFIAFMDL